MKAVAYLILAAASVSAFVAPKHMPSSLVAQTTDSLVALEACRRNTKKEKRQRNQENMRKFKRGAAPAQRGAGGKKKSLSRKKLTLKAQRSASMARRWSLAFAVALGAAPTGGAYLEGCGLAVWAAGDEGASCTTTCAGHHNATCDADALALAADEDVFAAVNVTCDATEAKDADFAPFFNANGACSPMADGGAYSCGATPKGPERAADGHGHLRAHRAVRRAAAPTAPSASPSYAPTAPTASPSYGPTVTPTSAAPTHVPVPAPSRSPTTHLRPTVYVTPEPTVKCAAIGWLLGAAAESCSETCARDHRACHDDEADAARDRVDEWGEVAAMVAARGGNACAGGWVNGNAMAPYVNTNNGNCFGRGPDAAVAGFCGLAAEAKRRLCPCCSSGFAPSPEPTKRERPDWQGFPEEPQEDDDDDDSSYNSRAGILSSGAQAGAGVAGVALTIFAIY
ncbi:RING finger ubiquitin ligase [Aureococcus anophagefferens]|nr:RING finger ubiquitin ligase [Aureococcus anophagefferens]